MQWVYQREPMAGHSCLLSPPSSQLEVLQGLRPWLIHICCIPTLRIRLAAQIAIDLGRIIKILLSPSKVYILGYLEK